MIVWVILGLVVLLALVAIAVTKKKGKQPTDYYTLFVIGIIWLPFGIVMKIMDSDVFIGNFFIVLGFIYSLIGLLNKKSWKKNHRTWNELNNERKSFKIIASLILGLAVLIGLSVVYFFVI